MLGVAGFVLLALSEYAGDVEQAIETSQLEDFCRGCGAAARLDDRLRWGPRPAAGNWTGAYVHAGTS